MLCATCHTPMIIADDLHEPTSECYECMMKRLDKALELLGDVLGAIEGQVRRAHGLSDGRSLPSERIRAFLKEAADLADGTFEDLEQD